MSTISGPQDRPDIIEDGKTLGARMLIKLGRALRVPPFRNLLLADLVSDVGTFMQSLGAVWLKISLTSFLARVCGFGDTVKNMAERLRALRPQKSDTSDTFFVVNGGRRRFWEATDPKSRKCLKPA